MQNPYLIPYIQVNSKWIKDLIRPKTTTGKQVKNSKTQAAGMDRNILDKPSKVWVEKAK